MSEQPIQVGDAVMVVKLPVCGCDLAMGWVFTVEAILPSKIGGCSTCGADRGPDDVAVFEDGCVELFRLKRLPPFADLEGLESEERITKGIDIPLEV